MYSGLKVFFPDTGAAALARRDWGETPFKVADLGSSRTAVEDKIAPEDEQFLLVNPAAVEVAQVEKLYIAAAGRPVILLNPRLEDVATIGIGYAGRQLRDAIPQQNRILLLHQTPRQCGFIPLLPAILASLAGNKRRDTN